MVRTWSTRTWILLVAVVLGGGFAVTAARTAFFVDDSFISYRYAEHLASGLGLVWNPGERVEGYTNFLWVLVLALGIKLGGDPLTLSRILGVACAVALIACVGRCVWRVSTASGWRPLWIFVGCGMLALSESVSAWAMSGLETLLFSVLLFSGIAMTVLRVETAQVGPAQVEPGEGSQPSLFWSGALLAGATLTRPNGALAVAIAGLVLVAGCVARRVRVWDVLIWGAPIVVLVGGHLGFRLAYYGEWVPNTFFAKVPAANWSRGFEYLSLYVVEYYFVPVVAVGLGLLSLVWGHRWIAGCFLTYVLSHALYICSVGGGIFEFRFFVPTMALAAVLAVDGVRVAVERLRLPGFLAWGAVVYLVAGVGFAGFGARKPSLAGTSSVAMMTRYTARRTQQAEILAEAIESGRLSRRILLATRGAGILPYYTRWDTVDLHGLNDKYVARHAAWDQGARLRHQKKAPYAYLVERRVAVMDLYNRLVWPDGMVVPGPGKWLGKRVPTYRVALPGGTMLFGSFLTEPEVVQLVPAAVRVY